ncbi:MAG: hypothetical protein KC994_26830, partial [Candidatus Omnitrophica bacterium]|nr:hypothetical protein [Candidatus Omnitrophota bacterium]
MIQFEPPPTPLAFHPPLGYFEIMSSLEKVLKHFRTGGKWSSQVAHWQTIPPKAARFGEWPSNLHPEIVAAIKERGIEQLYSHQTEAVRINLEGKNVVVV